MGASGDFSTLPRFALAANGFHRPVEKLELNIIPADFFTENPALDVPSSRDVGSRLVADVATNGP